MFAKARRVTFIDELVFEVQEAKEKPLMVALRNEDGKICCKTEKYISTSSQYILWEGLNDLPYGVYTLECSQGEEIIEMRMVKRV